MKQQNTIAFKLAIKHYLEQIRLDWKTAIPGLFLTGVGMILVAYVPPLIIADILGKYAENAAPTLNELIGPILLIAATWYSGELLWRVAIHLLIRAEANGSERLYINAVTYLLEKDLTFFHDNFAGSLTKKTNGYASRYVEFMDILSFNIVPYLLPLIFISFILWQFSPWLVVALVGILGLGIAALIPLIKRRQRLVMEREAASNKMAGYVSDIYSNIDAIRAFAKERQELKVHSHNTADYVQKMKKSWDYHNLKIDMVTSPFYVGTNVAGLMIAVALAPSVGAGIAAVFLTFSYFSNITRFIWEFNSVYRRIETCFSDAAQFTEMLLDEPKVRDIAVPQPFAAKNGAIEFMNVTFDHGDGEEDDALFHKLNLSIKAGEKIGLVGHSGGGKTTLTKLIMRLMNIDKGQILIDGQDISQIRQRDLRDALSYVPQDPIMFHRSLRENIAYGKPNASQAEIEAAAQKAHAHEFISKLPAGYDTMVGERGVKLSGGQRQRIAIARAMLKDAPILLLDEATSALDSQSEKLIQDALQTLMQDKTAIVIAHRLSTIQKMDRILVLDNGEIVEEGTHKQLVDGGGIYSTLWRHQSGGFIEE